MSQDLEKDGRGVDILISQEPEPLVPQETLYANNIVRRANDIVGARLSEN